MAVDPTTDPHQLEARRPGAHPAYSDALLRWWQSQYSRWFPETNDRLELFCYSVVVLTWMAMGVQQ